jgi:hypothetical protein
MGPGDPFGGGLSPPVRIFGCVARAGGAVGNRDVAGGGRIPGDELFSVGGKVGGGFRF